MTGSFEVEPLFGMLVPDPEWGGHLPPEGRLVEKTPYWLRRLRDGSVVLKPAANEEPSE